METKLRAPALRPGCVPRPRVLERLRGTSAPLVLLGAPVGYGKATLLAEWRASEEPERAFAWVYLDAADADPARFWSYVVEALRLVQPGFGETVLPALRAPGPDLAVTALPRLVNELAGLSQPMALVLDDYHRVRERRCHDLLAVFLEHLPPNLTVALATRSDAPLPLGRARARGKLVELRAADLRFTEAEASALFTSALGTALDGEAVAGLVERTEGWPAGLYLAALSLQGRGDVQEFLRDFSGGHRHIATYLTGEMFEEQDPAVRRFMARTSILERIRAPLADAVAGLENSAKILSSVAVYEAVRSRHGVIRRPRWWCAWNDNRK